MVPVFPHPAVIGVASSAAVIWEPERAAKSSVRVTPTGSPVVASITSAYSSRTVARDGAFCLSPAAGRVRVIYVPTHLLGAFKVVQPRYLEGIQRSLVYNR